MTPATSTLVPRVAVGSLRSPLEVGADRAAQAARDLARLLRAAGCDVLEFRPVDTAERAVAAGRQLAEHHAHAVALVAASWFEDYLVLDLIEECPLPVLLWPLPGIETGSLCGTQQLASCLKQLDRPCRCLFGPLESEDTLRHALTFLRAVTLKHQLRRARIGLGGHRVNGMTESSPNEVALKKAIGPRIVPLDMPLLLERAAQIPETQALERWQAVVRQSGGCKVTTRDGLDSIRVYFALKEQIDRHRLDALTIGCYPHAMGRVCLAASLLADDGVPLGCEGDVNGAVGQLLLTRLTGHATHNTDWLEPLEDDSIVFTHCGSGSHRLAENPKDITLSPVRLMNQGVCSLFTAKPGPVTLVNLIPRGDSYQLALLEGDAIPTPMVFPGNPLRVRFRQPASRLIDWVFAEGIGHHWMAAYGHAGAEIRQWAALCGPALRCLSPP